MLLRAAALGLGLATSAGAQAGLDVTAARYTEPTTRYAHAVLGDAVEWGAVEMDVGASRVTVRLPQSDVFEDLMPRVVDVDLDGARDVAVIETRSGLGARFAVYRGDGSLLTATPYIGRNFRWLAPVAIADLDGDGAIELAYIDRPHLAKTLRVWRYRDGDLTEVASSAGLTNHRIGDAFIVGGLKTCGSAPEMITVDAGWDRIMATRLSEGQLSTAVLGPYDGRASIDAAMQCP